MTAASLLRPRMHDLPKQNIADLARWGFERTDVIPLWFGEGDMPTPDFIGRAAEAAIRAGHTFYTHQRGIPELREALSDYMSGLYARPVGTERITVTSGGMPAILLAMQAILDAGDNVVVCEPVWPNVSGAIHILGAEKRPVMMQEANDGWRLDLDDIAARCDARTRAIFLATPGNPTGWIMPREQMEALLAFARARGVWIISDEVYARLSYETPVAPSFLDVAGPEDPVMIVNSFSKSWLMTGWRLGWLTHPPSIGELLARLVQYNSSGSPTFLQHAGAVAVREGEEFIRFVRERCRQGRDIACDALERVPGVRLRGRPKGGMYVYFEMEGQADAMATCARLFEETGVGIAPGSAFGEGLDAYLRICIGLSPDKLTEAMARLVPALAARG
jgi:aspartate aminotransferase